MTIRSGLILTVAYSKSILDNGDNSKIDSLECNPRISACFSTNKNLNNKCGLRNSRLCTLFLRPANSSTGISAKGQDLSMAKQNDVGDKSLKNVVSITESGSIFSFF